VVISLLLQPLSPFILAIIAGLMAGVLGMSSGSMVLFAGTVIAAALVVALLDVVANLRAQWGALPGEPQAAVPLTRVVWELLTANVVVIGVVGAFAYGVLAVLR
jgi:hypothetical protein